MTYTQKKPLILASSSPRRRKMLGSLGISFRILSPHIEERSRPGEPAADFARRIACEKAEEGRRRIAEERGRDDVPYIVLAADTIVVRDGTVLGKPNTPDGAAEMLRSLSGRRHEVITGLCVLETMNGERTQEHAFSVLTGVEFRALHEVEIQGYVRDGEPMDKAGAYGIQGQAAGMVRALNGSYTNVVGLPLCEVIETLIAIGALACGDSG